MNIYAIGDLHLSGTPPTKPMTIFGQHWENHWSKIKASWLAQVQAEDTVILCGDTSWAMHLTTALADLTAISDLPGQKIILRGNHDYWWSTLKKLQTQTQGTLAFLQNNFYASGQTAICGTRGWNLPLAPDFTSEDFTIYQRECLRLENSLQQAQAAGYQKIIVALHYPPLYNKQDDSMFAQLCTRYRVHTCVFGHIHGEDSTQVFQGELNGTTYRLVSADTVAFQLQLLPQL
ncbi:MAG: metallophosphoesterase [Acidaminococcaceae bacterium]